MNFENFKSQITDISTQNNIMLSEEQILKFYKYMNLLTQWNEKINLTAITDPLEIIEKHFIDSLTIMTYIKDNQNLIDIGTGAGFPGIPLNIVNSKMNITLLDSLNKRIIFLNEVIKELDLENIKAIHSRAEDYNKENREKFDIAVSRAVANMSTLVEYLLPYVKIGGICICMKGPNIEDELSNSKKAIKLLGGEIEEIKNFNIGENERNIIIIRKKEKTPTKFPRKAGMPTKEPIK